MAPVLIVVSDPDPVAARVAEAWGTPPATGEFLDGTPIRRLGPATWMVRRPGPHIHDERLDARLPAAIRATAPTLVFPSIHRSEQNVRCLTVHPLGNPGPSAEVGGRPRTVVPTDPARMAVALRRLAESGAAIGLPATFEATHHGPELGHPAFFAEIGYGIESEPPGEAVRLLAATLTALEESPDDRVGMAVGGGHYAPHFTELVLERRWAFGHLLSRHAIAELDRSTARAAWEATPGAVGVVYARAADADHPAFRDLAPRARDSDAPRREPPSGRPTPDGRSSSGT